MPRRKTQKQPPAAWRSRIVGREQVDPRKLEPHPLNHRTHPDEQRAALRAAIREVGFVRSVTVNRTTGRVLDGHLRLELALEDAEPLIDVEYVELTEDEERLVLASLDRITAAAGIDTAKLDALLREVQVSEPDLQKLLADMAGDAGLYGDELTGDAGNDGEPAEAELLDERWGVFVECEDEQDQVDFLARMHEEGRSCRALIS
jgi:hypothetical protein